MSHTKEPRSARPIHTPLHLLGKPGAVSTGGRLDERATGWMICNAHACVALETSAIREDRLVQGELARVQGEWTGGELRVAQIDLCGGAAGARPTREGLGASARARARMTQRTRAFFEQRDFLEVTTPCLVPEPGTDVYLEPFKTMFIPEDAVATSYHGETASARPTLRNVFPAFLQTSPEFAMKRLLREGFERIWQQTRGWRNGEVTDRHVPEFTILEWYRAWEDVGAIIDDVEELTRHLLDGRAQLLAPGARSAREISLDGRFERVTMRDLFEEACGFDLLDVLDYESFREAAQRAGLIGGAPGQGISGSSRVGGVAFRERVGERDTKPLHMVTDPDERWGQLFFELQVTHLDPLLERMGAVFVTEWPAPLAVLAKRFDDDPRVAQRFELYVGGLELANGFGELTDAREQSARFMEDLRQRQALSRPGYPLPKRFLSALEQGMPPSAGVAMGVDRLLMLATGVGSIAQVTPFSLRRDHETGEIGWDY